MKIRNSFVTNSSSSSFCIFNLDKKYYPDAEGFTVEMIGEKIGKIIDAYYEIFVKDSHRYSSHVDRSRFFDFRSV